MEVFPMKKIIAAFAAILMALTAAAMMGGCDIAKDTGNKIVSNAKGYLESEIGFDGNTSDLKSKAGSYLQNELGLNGDNDVIAGTWKQTDATNGDWVWTFDGKGKCTLQGITTGFSGEGTYSVDAYAGTVKVKIDAWDNEKLYKYTLRKTLSDETLDLNETYSSYHLVKQN